MFYNLYSEPQNERYHIDDENYFFPNPSILENSFHIIDRSNIDGSFFSSILDTKDKDLYFKKDNQKYFYKDIKHDIINLNMAEKQTNDKTEINKLFQKENSIYKNEINNKVEDSYKLYTFEEIKNILEANRDFSSIIEKFKKSEDIEFEEKKLLNKKRKIEKSKEKTNINEEKKGKRGRKGNKSYNKEEHNKMSQDNIIKKIKSKIFNYIIIFMNNMIDESEKGINKFYKLNYKYINQINRNIDLQFLEMKIEELLSMEISPKLKKKDPNFNKNIINKIKNKEEYDDVKDYNTIIFVLNLTFEEWLSLLTLKKSVEDLIAEKELYEKDINIQKIKKNLNVPEILGKMTTEDDFYFSKFIFLLYNYERWFTIKKPRNKKSKK